MKMLPAQPELITFIRLFGMVEQKMYLIFWNNAVAMENRCELCVFLTPYRHLYGIATAQQYCADHRKPLLLTSNIVMVAAIGKWLWHLKIIHHNRKIQIHPWNRCCCCWDIHFHGYWNKNSHLVLWSHVIIIFNGFSVHVNKLKVRSSFTDAYRFARTTVTAFTVFDTFNIYIVTPWRPMESYHYCSPDYTNEALKHTYTRSKVYSSSVSWPVDNVT